MAWKGLYSIFFYYGVNSFYLLGILFWNRRGIFFLATAKVDEKVLKIRLPMVVLCARIDEIIVKMV
jgi:hypothetical protein